VCFPKGPEWKKIYFLPFARFRARAARAVWCFCGACARAPPAPSRAPRFAPTHRPLHVKHTDTGGKCSFGPGRSVLPCAAEFPRKPDGRGRARKLAPRPTDRLSRSGDGDRAGRPGSTPESLARTPTAGRPALSPHPARFRRPGARTCAPELPPAVRFSRRRRNASPGGPGPLLAWGRRGAEESGRVAQWPGVGRSGSREDPRIARRSRAHYSHFERGFSPTRQRPITLIMFGTPK
jgi:hypothetical protein